MLEILHHPIPTILPSVLGFSISPRVLVSVGINTKSLRIYLISRSVDALNSGPSSAFLDAGMPGVEDMNSWQLPVWTEARI